MSDILTRVDCLEVAVHSQGQATTAAANTTTQIVYRVQDIEVALRRLESAAESIAARLENYEQEDVGVEDDALKHLEGVL